MLFPFDGQKVLSWADPQTGFVLFSLLFVHSRIGEALIWYFEPSVESGATILAATTDVCCRFALCFDFIFLCRWSNFGKDVMNFNHFVQCRIGFVLTHAFDEEKYFS
jgi:hypothetical protein